MIVLIHESFLWNYFKFQTKINEFWLALKKNCHGNHFNRVILIRCNSLTTINGKITLRILCMLKYFLWCRLKSMIYSVCVSGKYSCPCWKPICGKFGLFRESLYIHFWNEFFFQFLCALQTSMFLIHYLISIYLSTSWFEINMVVSYLEHFPLQPTTTTMIKD